MKFLFVCEGFNTNSINVQPWKHVFELAKGLQNKGHIVCILTDNLPVKELTIAGLFVKSIRKGTFLFNMQELNKIISEEFDMINWNASSIISSFQFKRLQNIHKSFVWTLHSGVIDFSALRNLKIADASQLTSLWSHILSSSISTVFAKNIANFSRLKAIITLSTRMKNYITKLGINEKIVHVTYSGVDLNKYVPKSEQYKSKIKEELDLKNDETIILHYGPLNSLRGVDELVKAVPKVSSITSNIRFVFLGRTGKYDFINQKIRKEILNNRNTLLIEGFLEQDILMKYLYAADIIVLPFRLWPFVECPLTVLEAMALGKPLITTYVGAIPEIVRNNENGLLVNPRSEEIANAILKFIKDKDFAVKLGFNARVHVEKHHSWNYIIDRTEHLFQSLVG